MAARVRDALDLVQLGDLGGAQRLEAVGRPAAARRARPRVVFSPSVLLFDEPLSNLDAKLRGEMRIELKELQRRLGITSVYVTHDLEEALAISDRIVVMRDGVIEQDGTPGEIYDRPRNTFVADFVGSANLIRGRRRARPRARRAASCWRPPGGALVHGTALDRRVGPERAAGGPDRAAPARPRAPGGATSTCGRRASASACSRATSRSTTSSGTGGR